jgi:hypothetical protein
MQDSPEQTWLDVLPSVVHRAAARPLDQLVRDLSVAFQDAAHMAQHSVQARRLHAGSRLTEDEFVRLCYAVREEVRGDSEKVARDDGLPGAQPHALLLRHPARYARAVGLHWLAARFVPETRYD